MFNGVLDEIGYCAFDRGAVTGGENCFSFGFERHLVSGRKRHWREIDNDADPP